MRLTAFMTTSTVLLLLCQSTAFALGGGRVREASPEPPKPEAEILIQDRDLVAAQGIVIDDALRTIRVTVNSSPEVLLREGLPEVNVTLASRAAESIDSLFNSARVSYEQGILDAIVTSSFRYCAMSQFNGRITDLDGLCLTQVIVSAPSGVKVTVNGKVFAGIPEYVDVLEVFTQASSDDDKIEALDQYLSQPNLPRRVLTISETIELLRKVTFGSGKKKVAELLSGRIIDPQDATLAGQCFSFSDERARAVSLLSR